MANTIHLRRKLISILVAMIALSGCAVTTLKAPCSWDEGNTGTAAFPLTGRGSAPLLAIGRLGSANDHFVDDPNIAHSSWERSRAHSCGPMRKLNSGSQGWH